MTDDSTNATRQFAQANWSRRRLLGGGAALSGADLSAFGSDQIRALSTGQVGSLSAAQVDRLREEFGVYLVRSGRICVAGLNQGNVEATAVAMAAVMAG